jgi:hypothetical protein
MTETKVLPREKAIELTGKFEKILLWSLSKTQAFNSAKHCAHQSVIEIIDAYMSAGGSYEDGGFVEFWKNVAQQIQIL